MSLVTTEIWQESLKKEQEDMPMKEQVARFATQAWALKPTDEKDEHFVKPAVSLLRILEAAFMLEAEMADKPQNRLILGKRGTSGCAADGP